MIKYNSITYSSTEPTSPALGDWWIKPIAESSYQAYVWNNNEWHPIVGGGIYTSESDYDTYYINTIIQETEPTSIIKNGWFWLIESTNQLYIYLGEFIPLVS